MVKGRSLTRRIFLVVGLGVVLVATTAMAIYLRRATVLERDFPVPDRDLVLAVEPSLDLVERGRHVVSAIALCSFCHGSDLSGKEVLDDPWVGRLYTTNLTIGPGGIGAVYKDADWVRAIRFGVGPKGRSLLLMPSEHLSAISDLDLAAVIAHLRQVPPVAARHPATEVGWLIRFALSLGVAPDLLSAPAVDRSRRSPVEVPVQPTAEYGAYLVELGSCRFCHRPDLRGGLHPLARSGEPVPPDLTPSGSMADWNIQDFARAMREGRTPGGRQLDHEFMPWPAFAGMEDLEIEALWSYLRSDSRSLSEENR